jgi:hypothetical protein
LHLLYSSPHVTEGKVSYLRWRTDNAGVDDIDEPQLCDWSLGLVVRIIASGSMVLLTILYPESNLFRIHTIAY